MRTAAMVPSWTTAVNAAPGSSRPRKAGTIRRWAVLEIGRNSVSPWTMPRMIAWAVVTQPCQRGSRARIPAYRRARRRPEEPSVRVGTAAVAAPVRVRLVRPVDRVELLQRPAGADGDAGERALGQVHRHLRLGADPVGQALKQRSPAGEHDAAIHDVGGELGRRLVERLLDGVDDLRERRLEGTAHLGAREHHRLRQAADQVASPDLRLDLLGQLVGRADLELDLLRGLGADHQLVLALDVLDDRLVQLVAADADRLGDDDAA